MTTTDAQQILTSLDREAMLDLAQEMVKIPSFKTEETEVARYIAEFLGERGYEVQLQEVEPGRFQTIGIIRGSGGGKSLMLNGHIDIDPIVLGWRRDPWTPQIDGDRLYGGGIRNMKGGVTAMIEAAEAVRRSGVRLRGDLMLACVVGENMKGGVTAMIEAAEAVRRSGVRLRGDLMLACVVGELQGGVGTSYLCRNGPLTDMAVVPEPFGADNILTVHAGVVEMAIHTIGRARHISRMEEGMDAIEKMCKAVPVIKEVQFRHTPRPDLPGLPRINVGTITGGLGREYDQRGPNFVPDFCTVLVDARFLPGMTTASVKEDIEQALDGTKPRTLTFNKRSRCRLRPSTGSTPRLWSPLTCPRTSTSWKRCCASTEP